MSDKNLVLGFQGVVSQAGGSGLAFEGAQGASFEAEADDCPFVATLYAEWEASVIGDNGILVQEDEAEMDLVFRMISFICHSFQD